MVKDAGILRGDSSMEEKVVIILNEMSEYLSISQMKKLQEVILKTFSENEAKKQEISNHDFLKMFLDARKSKDALKEQYNITRLLWNIYYPR